MIQQVVLHHSIRKATFSLRSEPIGDLLPEIFRRVPDLVHHLDESLSEQPSVELRAAFRGLQGSLERIDAIEQLLWAHDPDDGLPISWRENTHAAIHIAPRMGAEGEALEIRAGGGLRRGEGHQRALQAEHGVRYPLLAPGRELGFGVGEELAESLAVADGIAVGATLVLVLQT